MLTLHWGSASDVGRIRRHNEDSFWVSDRLFVVADGMGGHAAGEIASDLAIAEFRRIAEQIPLRTEDITAAIWRANEQIVDAGAERADRFGMGTTLTGIGVVSAGGRDHWAVFNVGDSRVYRFAGHMLSQLTVDHSEVQEMVSAGQLLREEARRHPRRNVVTRSLGSDPAPTADVWVFPPVVGDRSLLRSAGLTGELADPEIAQVLSEIDDPQAAAEELIIRANAAGGHDNVTTVVVDLSGVSGAVQVDEDTSPRSALPNGGRRA
jgi:serine/threonine protein phosphatase PrpC